MASHRKLYSRQARHSNVVAHERLRQLKRVERELADARDLARRRNVALLQSVNEHPSTDFAGCVEGGAA